MNEPGQSPVAPPAAAAAPPSIPAAAPSVGPVQIVDARLLQEALFAVERLLKSFVYERFVHLLTAAASSAMLLYATFKMIETGEIGSYLGQIFGASGLAALATARSAHFFKQAFDLIAGIINRMGAAQIHTVVAPNQTGAGHASRDA
ncbi:hypothetical protein GLE_5381 [Lysobacter enzymogenes]|uniref:Uncharacterized protein n=1 Tax=Lysobacter enzymogenes TaxID=69 RepID=A0A0S2DQ76_LYSEN|nr:hypothetical protein [Lysobacter enzymogenes]ALN60722.1 hypothetical protein GLE_5381 [Lysobacter enzymogenes]QCW24317.1 hypothetical protein FE772_00190 [Lysobacter enzymogenes]